MSTEFEATFLQIDKDGLRQRLKEAGAILVREEYKQSRVNFDLQSIGKDFWEWARVRDEGDRITMAYKAANPDGGIDSQKEIEFEVSDFDKAKEFILALGARMTNYSVTLREKWIFDGVEIDIDTWPHLEPFVEIEGNDETSVKQVAEKLGFVWDNALFCGAGAIYEMKYGIHPDKLAKENPITLDFDAPNPFTS